MNRAVLESCLQDVSHAWRALRARPGFTAVALVTIALGLGANTAIFSVVNAVYFRPLPFDAESRLMRVQEFSVAPDGTRRRVSARGTAFELVRDHATAFDAVVAQTGASYTLDAGEGAERVAAGLVSDGWGALLGVTPAIGRHFSDEEAAAGESARAVLIGHGLWQRHLGGRPEAVGETIRLSGSEYTVVGVMPPGFRYPYDAELWLPARFAPDRGLYVVARLAPGATLAQANAELEALGQRLATLAPDRAGMGLDAHSIRENLRQDEGRVTIALMGAVGFLLLIACANVAMLLTTRFAARRREVAVRAALGGTRGRQLQQFIVESVLLFALGGVLGLILTLWMQGWLTALVPRVLATQLAMGDVPIDGRVAAFGLLLGIVTGVAFGGVAALRASSADLHGFMKEGGRGASAGGRRTLHALVVAEVALSLVLLTCAGLMVSAFQRAEREPLGLEPAGLLTFRLDLSQGRYTEGAARLDLVDRLRERLASMPGVRAAGAISVNPLCCGDWGVRVVVDGQVPPTPDATPVIFHRYATPGLIEAMGVRLLEGRWITPQDTAQSQPVVVVDEPLARRFFPGRSAIGGRIKRAPYDSPFPWLTIVGVVADVREEGEYHEGWYVPYAQDAAGPSAESVHVMVRAGGDPLALVPQARALLAEIDRSVAPFDFTTMDGIRTEGLQRERMGTVLVVAFAGLGLMLSAVGVYGLMAFLVAQQTREMGIRVALGAAPRQLLREVLRRGLRLTGAGAAIGVAGSFATAPLLGRLIDGVPVADARVLLLSVAVLMGASLVACLVPAGRALRVDPVEVLRMD